ncbi:putative gag-pol polyprotein [Cucumis melo var. makuwa]|uniref:Gag-pol polyprotein n=1 Tax=Cucumis melo var. makuwa TaxID=1194695 RepID=A0A5D3DT30_CUCMM|nr:putative gag-pol polyprotein [Cucumis melo var. makuwa]TYK26734.1 putative gag-pol polyprotein [Cucumis melo var. makuwa]
MPVDSSTLPAEVPKVDAQTDGADINSKTISKEVIADNSKLVPSAHVKKNHPSSSIIGDPSARTYWINAMQEELLQFRRNNVWTLVPKPEGANIIGTKWIFKNKTDEAGCATKNKARLVAQGYAQVERVYFDETFAPISRLESINLLVEISCIQRFKLYQMDVKSAFLNGYLNEEVYVAQPKGFIDSEYPQHVYKLNKALYGLKQASRAWYERLAIYLNCKGYFRGGTNKTLFIHITNDELIVAQIYVDDIIFGGFPQDLVNNFIDIMKLQFEMSMSQHKRTPAATQVKITKDTDGARADHKLYRSIIGSLLYLTASRPDIAYAVGIYAHYQADPQTSHLEAVKRILKYVHGTSDFGILYSYDTTSILVGYCDADWVGSSDDRKSTSGDIFTKPLDANTFEHLCTGLECILVNTRKGSYMVKSSEDEPATQILLPSVQKVKMRGRRFKSTPPWRPCRLSSEKSQAEVPIKLPEFLLETVDYHNPTSSGAHAPNVPESCLSDMDSDDLDDMPLT